jgi:hypothetical protein
MLSVLVREEQEQEEHRPLLELDRVEEPAAEEEEM